ncbi:DUF2634 domain-containing protein [Acetoanaerobium noterae]|uniref:DUF2634 domain-containing protein n=1 Tax=Acetoanaerobium noterae TaxID=745369 RepID=UPI00333E7E2C
MIPITDDSTIADWEEFEQPSLTHRMNVNDMNIIGTIDGIEAIKQAIYKQLNTERYEHEIYGPDYGIELKDLFGQPKVLVYPILCYRIKECLEADDRIELVDGFFYDKENSKKSDMRIEFTVHSKFGDFVGSEVFQIGG